MNLEEIEEIKRRMQFNKTESEDNNKTSKYG